MAILRGIVNVALGKAEIREIPHPELPDDHVKVRPTAWAINPDAIDHLVQEGDESCAGCSVGVDYAGVVVEVGPRVSRNFKVGDRIVGVVPGQ